MKSIVLIVLLCGLSVNLCLACAPEKVEPSELFIGCECIMNVCSGLVWEKWSWQCAGSCTDCKSCTKNGTVEGDVGDKFHCGALFFGIPIYFCEGGCGWYYWEPMRGNLPVCQCVNP